MPFIRSLLFNVSSLCWTMLLGVFALPALLMPRGAVFAISRLWARGVLGLLALLVGLRHDIRGHERVPAGPVIYAVKHQSAWETLILTILIPGFAVVYKRQLAFLPFVGWYMLRADMIPINRGGGAGALRAMLAQARKVVGQGRSIVVMPEGTRTPPGSRNPYHPGIAALYRGLGLPVVPAALNSGVFWGRRSFVKSPGRITFEFLDPIAPGLDRRAFMALLEERIETAAERLRREAEAQLND
ncbi:MAG: lysophospholipid acyltransferase family protein [Alphaproteobacteria bacterium]|nr:lysophospholipid acyltransferase family protein [Alphaproteobacteria bacterium]